MESFIGSPQFVYVLMVLPGLFSLTLLGEGVSKIVKQEEGSMVCFVIGFFFLFLVGGVYFFFSTMTKF